MKTQLIALLVQVSLASSAFAAVGSSSSTNSGAEFDLMCRAKAKEVAAETYRGCVTEAKTQQIEQIKKDYQEKLKAMKQDYENELKKLSSSKSANSANLNLNSGKKSLVSNNKKSGKAAKNTKVLPTKAVAATQAAGNESGSEEMTVEIKQATSPAQVDESALDIPEPTQIEDVPTTDSASIN